MVRRHKPKHREPHQDSAKKMNRNEKYKICNEKDIKLLIIRCQNWGKSETFVHAVTEAILLKVIFFSLFCLFWFTAYISSLKVNYNNYVNELILPSTINSFSLILLLWLHALKNFCFFLNLVSFDVINAFWRTWCGNSIHYILYSTILVQYLYRNISWITYKLKQNIWRK